MTDERVPAIPSDLVARYKRLSEYKPLEVAVCDIYVREYQNLIERISALEHANADLTAQVAALSKPVTHGMLDKIHKRRLQVQKDRDVSFDTAEIQALNEFIAARTAPKEDVKP